jgi:hypothetical protein
MELVAPLGATAVRPLKMKCSGIICQIATINI